MSTTKRTIARRTIIAAAAGAAGLALTSQAKADDESPLRGPYKIEDWGKTWRNPNKDRVLARVPAIALPDIAGYWPQTTRPVRGPQEYAKRITDLLDFIPDFRAEPIEHATNGMSCSCVGSPGGPAPRDPLRPWAWTASSRPTATSGKI